METLWHKVKKGFILAVEKSDELTRMGKLKMDIVGTHRNIKKNFEELGGRIYELTKTGRRKKSVTEDEGVSKLMKNIKKLEKELTQKEKQLDKLFKK